MSGYTPVQVPNFGETLARAQSFQDSRLAALAQQRALDRERRMDEYLAANGQALAGSDPAARQSALAGLLPINPGMALPMLRQEREAADLRAALGGGAPAAPAASALPPGDMSQPRGLRNNNPLNLSYVPGQPGVMGSDGRFGRYGSIDDGIAAATRQLQMYAQRGLTTLPQIIGRWAPASDGNNVPAYIASVARASGLPADQPLNLGDPAVVSRLVAAMAQHENGRPFSPDMAMRGVQAALAGTPVSQPAAAPAAAAPSPGVPDAVPGQRQLPPAVSQLDAQIDRLMQIAPGNAGAQRALEALMQRRQALMRDEGTAPRSPERLQQDLQLAQAGASRTTVNSGEGHTQRRVSEQWGAAIQQAQRIGQQNALLTRAEQAFERFQPGALAEPRIWLGTIARELGIRSNVAEGEMLRAIQRRLELAAAPSGQGAITDFERGLIQQSLPILTGTPEGARRAIQLIRRMNEYDIQVARMFQEEARASGGQPDPVRVGDRLLQLGAPLDDVERAELQSLIDSGGRPGGGPGAFSAEPPSGGQPTMRYNPATRRLEPVR